MTEERSHRLLATLEDRAGAALDELVARRRELRALKERVSELEALRLELSEENRELSEQNRELDEDNARLRERLQRGEPAPAFAAGRPAQGLSALIGHRPRAAKPSPEATKGHPPEEADRGSTGEGSGDQPASGHAERQANLPIEQAPSPEALLAQWYQRYPQTFFKGHTRPLKVGIHLDLAEREPWPEKLVRRALAGYVNLPRYLKGVREGAERIGLDGQPQGTVDAQAAEHAHRKLERLQAERQRRGGQGRAPKRKGDDAKRTKARRHAPQPDSPRPKAGTEPAPDATPPGECASPEVRMEAKLSALVAKHNGRR
ncbi:ProQ/FINO family protein [Halomonas faecis]|uniref:ProQ/FINO family protein n=1 Tax=Halomonas faecis TaxID=1562110 RepID=UPI001F09DBEF|nr:ProQ/FINO family protein [Halomonas faecis]